MMVGGTLITRVIRCASNSLVTGAAVTSGCSARERGRIRRCDTNPRWRLGAAAGILALGTTLLLTFAVQRAFAAPNRLDHAGARDADVGRADPGHGCDPERR